MTNVILAAGQSPGNVSFSTAQGMINRFLTLDRIKTVLDEGRVRDYAPDGNPEVRVKPFTREELAEKLGISVKELEELESPDFYESIANKISSPLTNLYCATKFADVVYVFQRNPKD